MIKSRLCQLLSDDQPKSSAGCCPVKLVMPNLQPEDGLSLGRWVHLTLKTRWR